MGRANSRDLLLDAAECLIGRDGPGKLTLDAVAAEAKRSKGGILYHFPTKDALIQAMVDRMLSRFLEAHKKVMSQDSVTKGKWIRAYLKATFPNKKRETIDHQRVSSALLAAITSHPSLMEPVKKSYDSWQQELEKDGIDPATAVLVRLAVDGLWMSELLGLPPLRPQIRENILAQLDKLTYGGNE